MPNSLKCKIKHLCHNGTITERERDRILKALEQEPCEDAISRKELLNAIYTWDKFGCDADNKLVQYRDHYIPYIHYDDVVKCIKGMPSVNPQKIGHWIADVDKWGDIVTTVNGYRCDKCNTFNADKDNYCPNCGAKMSEIPIGSESEDKE